MRLETHEGDTSEDTIFLTAPRLIEFPRSPISLTIECLGQHEFQLGLHSRGFHHAVQIDLPAIAHRFEDNFFDLYPAERRKVRLRTAKAATITDIERNLQIRSLVDTY